MTELENKQNNNGGSGGIIIVAAVFIAILVFGIMNPEKLFNIMLVALGFGAVIMIHEFGHFIVAKLGGIKVEGFSIGFPPTLFALRKLRNGWRFRILPKGQDEVKEGDNETEYRVGLIPFGGYVKMMGQEDAGAAQKSDDPRSFNNRPISIRIAVVAAGVIFNAIGAIILFIALFMVGKELPPAVIGGVVNNSPAERVGLEAGDKVLEVNGEKFVDFTSLQLAPALSGKGEPINLVVQKEDGSIIPVSVSAELAAGSPSGIRSFGIEQAQTLTVPADIKDLDTIDKLYEESGFRPGDNIIAVNGKEVKESWDLEKEVGRLVDSSVTLKVSRQWNETGEHDEDAPRTIEEVKVPLMIPATVPDFKNEYQVASIFTMVPRLKIYHVVDAGVKVSLLKRIAIVLGLAEEPVESEEQAAKRLKEDDIILKIADVEFPDFKQMRELTTDHADKPMAITVFRKQKDGTQNTLVITVTPQKDPQTGRVLIGITPALDTDNAVVARTMDIENGPKALQIPPGARIVMVDDQKVNNFYDIARIIRQVKGTPVKLEYQTENDGGEVLLDIPADKDYITTQAVIDAPVPFELLKETYKAQGPLQAIKMGLKKTKMFMVQSVITIQRLITGDVPTKSLMGPVGIVSTSYRAVSQDFSDYLYLLGLISSCIVIMNLLPLPIVDGGVIILLIIEKIRGKALNTKVQEAISYAGLAFILAVFLWVTYNDILRLITGGV